MKRGRWYLVYTYDASVCGGMRDGLQDEEIALKATTEDEALVEARTKWADIAEKANARWEKQKATYAHPPSDAFDGISPGPRVVYRIPLDM